MHSHIFLDESGDLGWKLNSPYRNGGSSKFLTISYLISSITDIHLPRRIVREFYTKYKFNPKVEVKASELKSHHKDDICGLTLRMLEKYNQIKLGAITVKKENVQAHIRNDGNKLYNYMMGIGFIDTIENHLTCKITRDNRNIKVLNGHSCVDYLQTVIWFHNNKNAVLKDNPVHSHTEDGIIFIDWVTNMIWSKYEDNYSGWYDKLSGVLNEKKLFF